MIEKVVAAARGTNFTDDIDEIDMLSYTDTDGNTWEDRFDYIDMTMLPACVHFIGGTGHNGFIVPIDRLTTESLKELCDCIEQPAALTDEQKRSKVIQMIDDLYGDSGMAVVTLVTDYMSEEDWRHLYNRLEQDGAFS